MVVTGLILDYALVGACVDPGALEVRAVVGAAEEEKPAVSGKKPPKLRILIVDDEPLIRWALCETLSEAGHTLAGAGEGERAIDALDRGGPFDVVLIDVRQPVFNDLQHLATIRRLSPQSAVVVMTAFGTREMRETALDLGAYCIVPKPFEVKDMVELVLEAYESSAGLPVGAR